MPSYSIARLLAGIVGLCLIASMAHAADEKTLSASRARAQEALALLDSSDPYQRQLGFMRLEALRDPSTIDNIRPFLKDKDESNRAQSLRALAAIQGVAAIPVLLEALRNDEEPRVRRAALLGLEPLAVNQDNVIAALIESLSDRSTEVRISAVDIVSRIDDPTAREALRKRSKREVNKNVRRVLSSALKRNQ